MDTFRFEFRVSPLLYVTLTLNLRVSGALYVEDLGRRRGRVRLR